MRALTGHNGPVHSLHCEKGIKTFLYICHICLTSEVKVVKNLNVDITDEVLLSNGSRVRD